MIPWIPGMPRLVSATLKPGGPGSARLQPGRFGRQRSGGRGFLTLGSNGIQIVAHDD